MIHCAKSVLTEQISDWCRLAAQHTDAKHGGRAVLCSHDHTTAGILNYCQPSTNAYSTYTALLLCSLLDYASMYNYKCLQQPPELDV